MKSILPLPHTNCVLLLYVVQTVTKQVFPLTFNMKSFVSQQKTEYSLIEFLTSAVTHEGGSLSLLLMMLSGRIPGVKNTTK